MIESKVSNQRVQVKFRFLGCKIQVKFWLLSLNWVSRQSAESHTVEFESSPMSRAVEMELSPEILYRKSSSVQFRVLSCRVGAKSRVPSLIFENVKSELSPKSTAVEFKLILESLARESDLSPESWTIVSKSRPKLQGVKSELRWKSQAIDCNILSQMVHFWPWSPFQKEGHEYHLGTLRWCPPWSRQSSGCLHQSVDLKEDRRA